MQGYIEAIGKTAKGNTVITIDSKKFYTKDENPAFFVGSNISFQTSPQNLPQGKVLDWIQSGSVTLVGTPPAASPQAAQAANKAVPAQAPAPSTGGYRANMAQERMKTRSMIASYVCEHIIGKGLATADVVAFTMWADQLWNWVATEETCTGEEPV